MAIQDVAQNVMETNLDGYFRLLDGAFKPKEILRPAPGVIVTRDRNGNCDLYINARIWMFKVLPPEHQTCGVLARANIRHLCGNSCGTRILDLKRMISRGRESLVPIGDQQIDWYQKPVPLEFEG